MMLPTLLASAIAPFAIQEDEPRFHVDDARGFRIELPEGWNTNEQDLGAETGFVLTLLPPGSMGMEAVTITVQAPDDNDGEGLEAFEQRLDKRFAEEGDEFSNFARHRRQLAGHEVVGFRVDYAGAAGSFRVVQDHLLESERKYIVQHHAPVDTYDDHADELSRVAATFGFAEVSEEGRAQLRLAELAARCGTEVDWAETWDEAATRAREQDRLILVIAFVYQGFKLPETPRNTILMDEDVLELIDARYVPFWLDPGVDTPFSDRYGLSEMAFGQALLLATPEGDVLVQTPDATSVDGVLPFLLRGVELFPDYAGTPVGEEGSPLERAELHAARGEHARARELIEGDRSGRACRLRAKLHAIAAEGEAALAALAEARKAGGVSEAELLCEEGLLLMRERRSDDAVAKLERVLADFPETEAAAEAQLSLGLLDLGRGGAEAARERWRDLAERRPDSRFAWHAAAGLSSTVLDVDLVPDLGWPEPEALVEAMGVFEPGALPVAEAGKAADDALAWLLAHQRADGSWLTTSETASAEALGPNPFIDAIAALAGRALLGRGDTPEAESAARRALDFLLASIAKRKETPPVVLYMDYMTWSNSCVLHFVSDALAVGMVDVEAVLPTVNDLVADLQARQQDGGGWSYYVSSDLEGAAPAQSISFTTAAAVLAVARAREVGLPMPDEVLAPGVSALQRMRGENGVFSYFLFHDTDQPSAETGPAGAVGRGPLCELALVRAGESDAERLRAALDRFLEHSHLYAAEQGKTLMHAGPDGQGCHYLLFDYAHAALAQGALAADGRTRTKLAELILACRRADGSFLDTPILGRAYGTSMALLALDALGAE
ncbi:MAG: hypothetical protein AAF682_04500 [Planctomycetota bacterium]